MQKATLLLDKTISVPPGKTVTVAYVPIDCIILGCKDAMSIGDLSEKYELVKQNAPNALYPTPIGEWKGERFVIIDGRHTTMAYIMNGYTHILVSWLDKK